MTVKRTGGCLCGAVRYEVAWPPKAMVVCHCTDCQKQAGTAFSVVGVAGRDDLRLTGALETFTHPGSTGQDVNRKFCPTCGSPVLTETFERTANASLSRNAHADDRFTSSAPLVCVSRSAHRGVRPDDAGRRERPGIFAGRGRAANESARRNRRERVRL